MSLRFSKDPVTLVPLPWKEDNTLDKDMFARTVHIYTDLDQYALYFGCTASEGHTLSREQLLEAADIFVHETSSYAHPIFVGLAGFPMAEISERIELLKPLGLRTFLFAKPGWGTLSTEEEVDSYFNTLLQSHKDCQFILYNNLRSGERLYAPELQRIAKANPNFVAVKQGGHAYVDARYSAALEEPLPLVEYYLDYAWTYANLYFTPSFMPSTISCSFKMSKEFYEAGLRKDFVRLAEIDREIQKADQLLFSLFPGDRIDGAYDKMWVKMNIPEFPLRLAAPYQCFSDEKFDEYRSRMKELLPHWFS